MIVYGNVLDENTPIGRGVHSFLVVAQNLLQTFLCLGKRLFGGAFTVAKIAESPERARTIRLKVTFAVLPFLTFCSLYGGYGADGPEFIPVY
jgi:hypothetical protein